MKTTKAVIEAIEAEHSYIATKVRTEVWEERKKKDISTLECTDMAAVTEMFANNNEISYVVTNIATGEKCTYAGNEIRKWCMSQTLDNMVNYRITFTVVWDRASINTPSASTFLFC